MTILGAEPESYPDNLWEDLSIASECSVDRRWWCLHTKPRQEKAVARELRHAGVRFYLPQIVNDSRTPGGRKIRTILPLFPSYVFLHGDGEARLTALRGNRLVKVAHPAEARARA